MAEFANHTKSPLARALEMLLDESGIFSRDEWADLLQVSPPAISQWVNDKTLPRPELLRMIVDVLGESRGRSAGVLARFDELARQPAESISPHGERIGRTLADYMLKPLRDGFLRRLNALAAEHQEVVLRRAGNLVAQADETARAVTAVPAMPRGGSMTEASVLREQSRSRPARRGAPDAVPLMDGFLASLRSVPAARPTLGASEAEVQPLDEQLQRVGRPLRCDVTGAPTLERDGSFHLALQLPGPADKWEGRTIACDFAPPATQSVRFTSVVIGTRAVFHEHLLGAESVQSKRLSIQYFTFFLMPQDVKRSERG